MPGKAYMADTVMRDIKRLAELFDEIRSGANCGYETREEFEEVDKILRSYYDPTVQ